MDVARCVIWFHFSVFFSILSKKWWCHDVTLSPSPWSIEHTVTKSGYRYLWTNEREFLTWTKSSDFLLRWQLPFCFITVSPLPPTVVISDFLRMVIHCPNSHDIKVFQLIAYRGAKRTELCAHRASLCNILLTGSYFLHKKNANFCRTYKLTPAVCLWTWIVRLLSQTK